MAQPISSKYEVGDTLKVVNSNSPYYDKQGVVARVGSAGMTRISYHIDFPNIPTTRDVGEGEVELVEKRDPVMSPQVAKEPVRVEPAVDDQPRVIIPAPSVPAVSDVEVDAVPTKRPRGRPKGSKNKPKSTTTAVKSKRK